MNTKLHAICDSQGRPLNLFVTAGQVSDYIGARALLGSLPNVGSLLPLDRPQHPVIYYLVNVELSLWEGRGGSEDQSCKHQTYPPFARFGR